MIWNKIGFLFANDQGLAALIEPYLQRVVYLIGVRPYMERQTGIVRIKRKISHQSLREMLYVAPAGEKTGSPSLQQMKRAIKSLARAGFIEIASTKKQFILKCVFAVQDKIVQKQAVPRAASKADIPINNVKQINTWNNKDIFLQAYPLDLAQADIPQCNNNYIFLYAQFEKFWLLYPKKNGEQKTWERFKSLNPVLCT